MDPLGFISTEVNNHVELLRLVDDLEQVRTLPHRVDIAVRGVLVSSTGRLVVSVTLDGLNMGP